MERISAQIHLVIIMLFTITGYGLTETSPVVTMSPLTKPKGGTIGMLLPNTEAKVFKPVIDIHVCSALRLQ